MNNPAWTRRGLIRGALATGLAGLLPARGRTQTGALAGAQAPAMPLSDAQIAAGRALLRQHASVDLHAHPGRFFLAGATDATPLMAGFGAPFPDKVITEMRAGDVTAVLFAAVADTRLIGATPQGTLYATRAFEPGEAWADYRRQIAALNDLVAHKELSHGLSPPDIAKAQRRHTTACIYAVEGGDFIENQLDRVHIAHADGVRAITIVHYHNNQIGDIQTQPLENGGLSDTGRAIVREMNRVGILVDVAHASERVVRDTLAVSTRPVMASHTNVGKPGFQHPRLITAETARLIASHGGLIGSVPSGIGQASFADWIESILRLIEITGVDHVAIGTDIDANYAPVFTDYRQWHLIPAALLARGLNQAETAKVMGGNFVRLFQTAANRISSRGPASGVRG